MCGDSQTSSVDALANDVPFDEFKDQWYSYLCDAHCHAHDEKQRLNEIQHLRTGHITLMGVRQGDWETVEKVALASNNDNNNGDDYPRCVPCFGIHPWYTYRLLAHGEQLEADHYQHVLVGPDDTEKQHLISQLAPPIPFTEWYTHLKQQLERHPNALLGEVGLDRSARLLPGGAIEWHGVKPTNVVCSIDHQCTILQFQLNLALQLDRAVSIHCVQSQGHLMTILQSINQRIKQEQKTATKSERPGNGNDNRSNDDSQQQLKNIATTTTIAQGMSLLRVCLHSFGGKPASLSQFFKWQHVKVYVSFSVAINARLGWKKLFQLIQTVPDDQLLIETDLNTPTSLDHNMVHIASLVAQAKGWSLHDTVMKTRENWITFTGVSTLD